MGQTSKEASPVLQIRNIPVYSNTYPPNPPPSPHTHRDTKLKTCLQSMGGCGLCSRNLGLENKRRHKSQCLTTYKH